MSTIDWIVDAAFRRVNAVGKNAGDEGGPAFIIGIDGHSAAGKSTLAGSVCDRLGGTLLHMDDFYRVIPENERPALTAEQGAESLF